MRQDVRDEWKEVSFLGDPRMLVGWREPHRRLNALRVKLHQDVFGELADLCRPAVDRIQNYRERLFENFAALDDYEYFWYSHFDLPKHQLAKIPQARISQEKTPSIEDDTADLVRLIHSVDALEEATRDDINDAGFSFYSICWPHRNSMMGFVSRTNPTSTLKPGHRYFQYGNTMRAAEHPDFALKEGADLVIGAEGTAILAPYSFEILLGDVGLSFDHVKKDIATIKMALGKKIKMTSVAEEALLAESSRTRSNAKRIRLLSDRLAAINLNGVKLRNYLIKHDEDPDLVLDENDDLAFDQKGVNIFLDAVESRFFEDELGGEKRRADRFSKR